MSHLKKCLLALILIGTWAANASGGSSFTFVSRSVSNCPGFSVWCQTNWPSTSNGIVYLYTINEKRTATGQTFSRSAYVYKPARLVSSSPAVIFFHGGNGSAAKNFEKSKLPQIADNRGANPGITWTPNSPTCQFAGDGSGYVDANGNSCTPTAAAFTNSAPFYVVFPNGLQDSGWPNGLGPNIQRHWEDGRIPSPGYGTTNEVRDDVGFTNFLITQIRLRETLLDASRIYVTGGSNGGMMALRVFCNNGNSAYSQIPNVAAFSVSIAALPEPLNSGVGGRELCGSYSAANAIPLALFVGKNIDTPNCTPYGCTSPTVSGDGIMPYGSAGGVYLVNSPDSGSVISSVDTQALIANFTASLVGPAIVQTPVTVGYFTTKMDTTFANSSAVFQIFEVDQGTHEHLATRMDFSPYGRIWEFVSSFRRGNDGSVIYSSPIWLQGSY